MFAYVNIKFVSKAKFFYWMQIIIGWGYSMIFILEYRYIAGTAANIINGYAAGCCEKNKIKW